MSSIITPGSGILFMKIGTHAQEDLENIIERKMKEIADVGYAMWGYGGNTCHPRTMVQPFAEEQQAKGRPIYLCMQQMNSRHFAEPLRAKRYSSDGREWIDVPQGINVLGSRFALMVESLQKEEHVLPLELTRVAIGPNRGRVGSRYLQGQVDKACLEVVNPPRDLHPEDLREVQINVVAKLKAPYAVFLRED
ncbi:hypothetical protein WMF30_52755 [Sorangium sp. So ce134]